MSKMDRVKTSEDYVNALKKLKPNVITDRLLEKPYEDKDIIKGMNVVSTCYNFAKSPEFNELMTAESSLTGNKVNRYNYIPRTKDDLRKRIKMVHSLARETVCAQRCVGGDALWALWIGTHQLDKSNKGTTNYHERLKKYLEYVQENDIAPAGAVTDAKGDRSISPAEQEEKDTYVHIVKKTDEGIYVSGIKTPITMSIYAEELIVMPSMQLSEYDKSCAVSFAIQADAEGIERYALGEEVKSLDGEHAPTHGRKYLNKEGMIIFNNVFVPNDRIFLCEEHKYGAIYANLFATMHRFSYLACKPALYDIMTGAAMLISDFNGTKGEYFLSNTSEKIFQIAKAAILSRGMAKAAIEESTVTESGAILPDEVFTNMGKFMATDLFPNAVSILQDMAGNLPVNLPYEGVLKDKKYGENVDKLFKRKKGITTEQHFKLNEFIRVMVASTEGGLLQFGSKHGGGNKEAEKVAIYANNLRHMFQCKKLVKDIVFNSK